MDLSCRPIKENGEMALVAAGGGPEGRPTRPQEPISLIIHEIDAKFFTFFSKFWHLEAGIGTILFRILWRTIPLKISKPEKQEKVPKIASKEATPC